MLTFGLVFGLAGILSLSVLEGSEVTGPIIATAGFQSERLFTKELTVSNPNTAINIQCHVNTSISKDAPYLKGPGVNDKCRDPKPSDFQDFTVYSCYNFTGFASESSAVFECISLEAATHRVPIVVTVHISPAVNVSVFETTNSNSSLRCFSCEPNDQQNSTIIHRSWTGVSTYGDSVRFRAEENGSLCIDRSRSGRGGGMANITCDAQVESSSFKYHTFGDVIKTTSHVSSGIKVSEWSSETIELICDSATSPVVGRNSYVGIGVAALMIALVIAVAIFVQVRAWKRIRQFETDLTAVDNTLGNVLCKMEHGELDKFLQNFHNLPEGAERIRRLQKQALRRKNFRENNARIQKEEMETAKTAEDEMQTSSQFVSAAFKDPAVQDAGKEKK